MILNKDVKVEGVLNINGYLYSNGGYLTGSGYVTYPKMDVSSTVSSLTTNPSWWVTPSNVSQLYPNNGSPYIYSYTNPYYYNGLYYYYYNGQIYYLNGNYYYNSSAPYGYCSKHPTVALQYCYLCGKYTCPICDDHSTQTTTYYCKLHNTKMAYCSVCKKYYCPYEENHVHSTGTTIYDYFNNYYWNNYYYPEYYYNNYRCSAPVCGTKSGYVEEGTKITLSSATTGAMIYYTLDGSGTGVGSYRYTADHISKNTTVKAIAALNGYITSGVSTFNFSVSNKLQYSDISKYDGLYTSLRTLSKFGVFGDSTQFDPKGTFSYDELMSALRAIGCDTTHVVLDDEANLSRISELSYNDFVYITYKVLRENDMIESPQKSGSVTLKQLRNNADITSAQIYKAAFASFIENGLFYDSVQRRRPRPAIACTVLATSTT